jgi:cyclophilin family peptidyl-prolyl cis-trans isomerase
MTRKTLSIIVAGILLISAGLLFASCGKSNPAPSAPATSNYATTTQSVSEVKIMKWDSPPKMTINTSKKYTATIETEKGNLVIELFVKDVPRTVNNFVFLATQGYYDGTTFHRVIPDFMAQGGDPTGTGAGTPGYRFEDEFTAHKNVAGALSMANSGPNTNGGQFFITYVATPWLDGKHTVFGQLIEGMDVLKKLTPRDPQSARTPGDKVIKVTIKVS